LQLAKIVTTIQKPNPPASVVRQYVKLCHTLAQTYLNYKIKSGRLDPNFFGVTADDLAMDCIAFLFTRSDSGEFTKIKNYFSSFDTATLTDDELIIRTRRLVFNSINDELYRLYKLEDPSLGNIIRCIKSALKYTPDLFSERVDGEIWLYTAGSNDNQSSLPLLPHEHIWLLIGKEFTFSMTVREIVHTFSRILKSQRHYQKRYPLIGLAYLIRTMYSAVGDTEPEITQPDDGFREDEIRELIKDSAETVQTHMRENYILRSKISPDIYDGFFRAIEQILEAQYVFNDGFDRSYYEYLQMHSPEICPESYRNKHRPHFEYLVRLAREELIKKIKKDF